MVAAGWWQAALLLVECWQLNFVKRLTRLHSGYWVAPGQVVHDFTCSFAMCSVLFADCVAGPDGEILFAGPRVRMGIHYAREGTVAVRLHNLTRHKVYAGPAVQIALDVSEAANGGQIVLTEVSTAGYCVNCMACCTHAGRCNVGRECQLHRAV
jgi:hypothetical protein